jgi:YggT family protein
MIVAIRLVDLLISLLTLFVFLYSLLSFFMSPYHPVREFLGKLVEPLLAPIRRVLPPTSGVDLSPLVLIIIIQILGAVLVGLLRSFS